MHVSSLASRPGARLRLSADVGTQLWCLSLVVLATGAMGLQNARGSGKLQQKAERIVGTAQSEEEFQAYQEVLRAGQPREMARHAEEFLERYPESGLSAFVHQAAVTGYQVTIQHIC